MADVPEVFIPIRDLLPADVEDMGLLSSIPGLGELLDAVYYSYAAVEPLPNGSRYLIALGLFEGYALQFPWLPGVEFRIGASEQEPAHVEVVCDVGGFWSLGVRGIPLRITFPPSVLAQADDPAQGSYVSITADVTIDEDLNLSFDFSDDINLPLSNVAGTGIAIELTKLSLNLTEDDDRRGVGAHEAKLFLPQGLLETGLEVTFSDFFVGETGISGEATWTAPTSGSDVPTWHEDSQTFTGVATGTLFGSLPVSVRAVTVGFEDNIPHQADVLLHTFIPYFDQVLALEVSLASGGDFKLMLAAAGDAQPPGTAVSDAGLVTLRREGVMEVVLTGLTIGIENGDAWISISGSLTPLFGGMDWPTFDVKGLSIDSTGRVRIDGGWIDVGKQGVIEFEGAAIEISKFGFGRQDDGTKWIGFSGGLKLSDPLPVSGSVEGLRVNWRGDDLWLTLKGAAVGFEVPDSVIFKGHLEFIEDPEEPRRPDAPKQRGFRGGGELTIIPTNMKITSEVVLGRSDGPPPFPFAYVYVDFQTPVGIPVFTNVSVYGFAGLLALNMGPAKDKNQAWWADWYLIPTPGVSGSAKWRPIWGAMAFGAGVTLGTSSDDGYAVHARLLLVLVLDGPPLIMFEGVAGFLEDRTALGDNSPVRALAVIDTKNGQFLMNMQARYPFDPDDDMKKIIDARGGAEAYFDTSGDWHFYMGERSPKSKRIVAEILQLFEARSYLMLLPDHVGLGIWVGYEKKWKYGPIRVGVEAVLDSNARLSWRPVQLNADLKLVGDVSLKAYGFGASVEMHADVEAQAPSPYKVHMEFETRLSTPRGIPDPKFKFSWDYHEHATPAIPNPIGALGVEHLKVSERWSLEDADSEHDAPIVPLDAKVAISFARTVEDAPLVGGTTVSGVPPWERCGRHEFKYRLTGITLERRPKGTASGAWETVASRAAGEDPDDNDQDKLWGVWLAAERGTQSGEPSPNAPMTKLLLHAKSPFEYTRENADDAYWDHFSDWMPDFGWTRINPPNPNCFGFDDLVSDEPPPRSTIVRGEVVILGLNLSVKAHPADDHWDAGGHLDLGPREGQNVRILFPEPIRVVSLDLRGAKGVRIARFDGATQVGQDVIPDGEPGPVSLGAVDGPNWNVLAIAGQCWLREVCYITAEEADRYLNEANTADTASAADDHYDDLPGSELLQPQSMYRVTVTADGRRRKRGESDITTNNFQRVAYFQTADPPGVFPAPGDGGLDPAARYPSGGALKDLSAYVLTTDEGLRCTTPENDARAVYRGYDVGVEFNEPYVEEMYLRAGMPLAICVYDANGALVGSERLGETIAPIIASSWQEAEPQPERPSMAQHKAAFDEARTRLDNAPDVAVDVLGQGAVVAIAEMPLQLDLGRLAPPVAIWSGGADFILAPRALYRATLEAMRPTTVITLDETGTPARRGDDLWIDVVNAVGSNLRQILEAGSAQPQYTQVMTNGRGGYIGHVKTEDIAQERMHVNMDLINQILDAVPGIAGRLGPPPQVFSWNFVSSHYVHFMDHAHSFIDKAWDRVVPNPLDNATSTQLTNLVRAAPGSESTLYATAAADFGVGSGQLPSRLEISVVADANRRYGFLIESPEPIDWRLGNPAEGRVSLNVSRYNEVLAVTEPAYSAVKITGYSAGAEAFIELLVRERADLTGYQLSVPDGGNVAAPIYHQFPANSLFRAGSVLRLYAGDAAPAPEAAEFIAITTAANPALLLAAGVTLSLNGADGTEVHHREFRNVAAPTVYRARVAPDDDGTRAFVFLCDQHGTFINELPDGTYRFDFTFRRRHAGGGRRVLRRNASANDEVATLTFAVN